jgi:hypothetical protein
MESALGFLSELETSGSNTSKRDKKGNLRFWCTSPFFLLWRQIPLDLLPVS